MKRGALVDLVAVLLLFSVGVVLRLPLVPLLDVSSDATDPIVGALRILGSWNPFLTDSPRFGYGRALSYVPLVLASEDGLGSVAVRRAIAQSLLAPTTYLSMRLLLSRLEDRVSWVLGPLVASLLLAVNQDLLLNLLWGHHGYFGPEWAAVLLLGFAGVLVGRRLRLWALLAGVALAMCAMNHPYAISAAAVLLVAWYSARRDGDTPRSWAAVLALSIAAAALLPHLVYLVSAPAVSVELDLMESVVPVSMLGARRPLAVVAGLFSNIATGEAVLFVAATLLALVLGRVGSPAAGLSRLSVRVGLATLATLCGLLFLALASRQVHNWHWRMLLPFCTACSGLVLAWLAYQVEVSGGLGKRFLAVVFALGVMLSLMTHVFRDGVQAYQDPAEPVRESLLQLSQVERVYGLLEGAAGPAPWTLLAYGLPPGQSYARSLPLALHRVLKPESKVRFSGTAAAWLQGPTLFYFEGPGAWIDAVADASLSPQAKTLWRGAGSLVLRTESALAAFQVGTALCAASAGASLYADNPRDALALLAEANLVAPQAAAQAFPSASPCIRSDP